MTRKLPSNQKIIDIDQLKKMGLTHYSINKLVQEGQLSKLTRKKYENTAYEGENDDFVLASAYVPTGVVCLMSAAVYYELSTFRPGSIELAVPNKSRVYTFPAYPELHLYYFGSKRYELGQETIQAGEDSFKIYNLEKTVVDIVSYREKIGIEETKEILTNYLARPDRNINKLVWYAERLDCRAVLDKYLEVLL